MLIRVNAGPPRPRPGPANTFLVCPSCGLSEPVRAGEVLETWPGGVRKQDRRCLACGHQWATVLPPRRYAAS